MFAKHSVFALPCPVPPDMTERTWLRYCHIIILFHYLKGWRQVVTSLQEITRDEGSFIYEGSFISLVHGPNKDF